MRKLLLASALAALPFAAGAVPTLDITATQTVGITTTPIVLSCAPGNPATGGTETCTGTSAAFSTVVINATGVPIIASPDLASIDVTANSSSGATLNVTVLQTGLSQPGPVNLDSSFTYNDLIGGPFGPATETTNVNGLQLATVTFPGTASVNDAAFTNLVPGPITSDSHTYSITFTGAGQEAESSIELQQAIPEPASLALFGIGLVGLGIIRRQRQDRAA